jgi:hypothetical protein
MSRLFCSIAEQAFCCLPALLLLPFRTQTDTMTPEKPVWTGLHPCPAVTFTHAHF